SGPHHLSSQSARLCPHCINVAGASWYVTSHCLRCLATCFPNWRQREKSTHLLTELLSIQQTGSSAKQAFEETLFWCFRHLLV
ncbi:unnamed protein product, partial [Ixodes persulcatus]